MMYHDMKSIPSTLITRVAMTLDQVLSDILENCGQAFNGVDVCWGFFGSVNKQRFQTGFLGAFKIILNRVTNKQGFLQIHPELIDSIKEYFLVWFCLSARINPDDNVKIISQRELSQNLLVVFLESVCHYSQSYSLSPQMNQRFHNVRINL